MTSQHATNVDTDGVLSPANVAQEDLSNERCWFMARDVAGIAVLSGVYFGTAKLGLFLDAVGGVASAVWPPTGIALFALVTFGWRYWPGIALGAFLVNSHSGTPAWGAFGMAAGNTLEAVLGAWLLRHVSDFRGSLERVRDVLALVLLAAFGSTLVSATIGVTSGWLVGVVRSSDFGRAWITWWIGDALGDLVVAPLLFIASQRQRRDLSVQSGVEGLMLVACVVLACWNVFFHPFRENVTNYAIVLLPFLVWAAMRFGQQGGVVVTAIISTLAIAGTVQGLGPFARPSLQESLLALQIFTGIIAVAVLSLAANVTERQEAQRDLRTARDALEKRVAERTAELCEVNTALTKEIAEHQLAERVLETQARVLRHMAEAVILADEDGGITYSNAATETMFGYTPDELLGRPLAGLMDDGTADKLRTAREISAQLDTGKTWFGELTNRKRDGTPFATVTRISPLEIAGKKVRVCVQQDLTELKHARERSLQFERLAAIGQMVTGLAHESGNALQQIQGAVERLARRVSGQAETDLLDQIQQAQDRLHRLLEDLRGYAAPIRLDRRVQNLARLWREAWRQLATRRANREVQFYEFSNGVDLNCLVDPFPMERVFRNIFENSLAACADPVRIEIRCSDCRLNHQPAISLSFRDNGPGLNAEQQHRIFEPFFTTKTTGTGLGMAIVKRLVEAHGGEVNVGCDNDPGANIVILLPRETP